MRAGLLAWPVSIAWGSVALGAEAVEAAPIPPGIKNVPREMKQYVVAFVLPGASEARALRWLGNGVRSTR